jgi:hypothetical protein
MFHWRIWHRHRSEGHHRFVGRWSFSDRQRFVGHRGRRRFVGYWGRWRF